MLAMSGPFLPARRLRRARAAVPAALALALLAALSLAGGCARDSTPEVWLIGLDGADWDILDPLIARGQLPHLARLKAEGAWGGLRAEEPLLSPILWTTMGTGRGPDRHGVTWFMSETADGQKIPVSSRDRRVRALWDIAGARGLKSGVVGWWATWPADPLHGWLVSDHAGWHSFGVGAGDPGGPGSVWPAELSQDVARWMAQAGNIDAREIGALVRLPVADLAAGEAAGGRAEKLQHLRQALATAAGYTEVAQRLLQRDRPRFFTIYYEGTDAVQHLFGPCAPPRLPWVAPADHEAFGGVVAAYWSRQDQLLGRLLERRGPRTTVILVSDHGFRWGDERLKEEEFRLETADRDHLPEGIILVHGPGVRAGARIEGADHYDIAPTILHLLGLPLADDMPGAILAGPWGEGRPEPAAGRVATHETGEWRRAQAAQADPQLAAGMERALRSLGYIAGEAAGEPAAGAAVAEGAIAASVEQAVNLAVVLRKQGRPDEAARRLEEVLAHHPGNVTARTNLARALADLGRLPEAEAIFRELLREQPQRRDHREDLARACALQDRPAEAAALYEQGLARDPEWATGLSGLGLALHQLGRGEEALAALDRAIALDPRLAEARYHRGVVLAARQRPAEAIAELERCLRLAPAHLQAAFALAELRERTGDPRGAEAVLQAARRQAGDDPELLARLGASLLRRGEARAALPLLESAAARRPQDPDLLGNIGLAHALGGDLERGAAVFEQVVRLAPSSAEARGQLGGLYAQQGRLAEAEPHLREAVRLAPADPALRLSFGYLLQMTRRLDDAEQQLREAVRLAPRQGRYLLALGLLYQQRGEVDRAAEMIQRARQLDPGAVGAFERATGSPLP